MARYVLGFVVLALLFVAACGSVEESKEQVSTSTAGAIENAKAKASSWSKWMQDKISGGFGMWRDISKQTAEESNSKTADVSAKTKDSASGYGDTTSQKVGESKEALKDKATGTKDTLSGKTEELKGKTSEKATQAKDSANKASDSAKEKVGSKRSEEL